MKTDSELQKDVLQAINWEPNLKKETINVLVKNGNITLSGEVDNYGKKIEAEHATKHVIGVKEIVNNMDVKFRGVDEKSDVELANEIVSTLKLCSYIAGNSAQIAPSRSHNTAPSL
ncbi:MAG: BON domain-containing protein [Bacteroidetes bacterium]|nr:BON domain-containing protein [Bacteroidota bacterium]